MEGIEVKELAGKGLFQQKSINGKVEETHISWVILTKDYAFKIKKPLKLSFLDFTTLELRKYFCERELLLNGRLTRIYRNVVPVCQQNGRWYIGEVKGKVVDYAVQMNRMAARKRMDQLLSQGKVTEENISSLVHQITTFHQSAEKVFTPFAPEAASSTFNDLLEIKSFVKKCLGNRAQSIVSNSIKFNDKFLENYSKRFQERIEEGFQRDVHGDLHSGNIFLYKNPVIFDCIEFNNQFRQIDLLYEIAFMCMDIEAFNEDHLAKYFISAYKKKLNCFKIKEDEDIFLYFKCLRANVRAKVHAFSAMEEGNKNEIENHIEKTSKYLELMQRYIVALE